MQNRTPDTLLYPIADALGIAIHEIDNKVRGFKTLKLNVGPWKFDADVSIISDYLSENTASFFIKVVGDLWLYMVSKHNLPITAYVVNGGTLKLHVKDIANIGGRSSSATLGFLKKGLVNAYTFDDISRKWAEDSGMLIEDIRNARNKATTTTNGAASASNLDEAASSKGTDIVVATPQTVPKSPS